MKREDIHAVIIASPNYLHREMVLEAARHGKHLMCEKPLALSVSEAKEMYEAVEKAGVKHMINFNYRKTPAILLIKKWIDDGKLGRILSFRSAYLQDWGMDEGVLLSWRFQKRYAGAGSIGDLDAHVIDMARFLVGEFSEVCGMTSTHVRERPLGALQFGRRAEQRERKMGAVDVDDLCDVVFTF